MVKYDIDKKKFSELRDKIDIPKFQRGLVWGKEKKREFIKTLKSGLPIGVLLLSPRKDKKDKYLIIDGLQRFTTMKEYSEDYFSYIDSSEITDSDLMTIILASGSAREAFDSYTDTAKQKTREEMRDIVKDKISSGQGKNLFEISKDAADDLCKRIAILPPEDKTAIQGAVFNIAEKIFKQAQIDDITIPIIVFNGKQDELADVFQKLNQEGVKLSKYDVFAATWINHTVVVKNDPKFIEYIIAKYEAAEKESNLDIAGYDADDMKQTGELTVFEYAFAVGKALMDECKTLFPKVDEAKIDSVGFLILAELMGLTYQKMGKLAETIDTYTTLDFKELKDKILEAGKFVETALGFYIESPSDKGKKKTSLAYHSELQVASYIIVVFKLKYELTPENGLVQQNHKKELSNVKEFLFKHYLYDILRGYWAGSGDSKLDEIVADPLTCRYVRDVEKDGFENAVSTWLSDANKKAPLKNVSADTKLFLNYLLRKRVPSLNNCSYDIEHCVPKDVIKNYYTKKGIVVPMSSVCNLTYIPEKDNRSKGELTYYQRQDKDPGTFTLNQAQLDTYLYPQRSELRFVESVSTLTEDEYFRFLSDRKAVLLNAIMDALYN